MFVYQILRYAQDDRNQLRSGMTGNVQENGKHPERQRDDDCHLTIGNSEILRVTLSKTLNYCCL